MNWRRLTASLGSCNGQNGSTARARRVNQLTFGECRLLARLRHRAVPLGILLAALKRT